MSAALPPSTVCVAQAVYHEARGAGRTDMEKVGELVWNRARDKNISPCDVISMKGQFPWYVKRWDHRESGKWRESISVAHATHWRISPVRYMVNTNVHKRFEARRTRYNQYHPSRYVSDNINVIYSDKILTFYNRFDDRIWKAAAK